MKSMLAHFICSICSFLHLGSAPHATPRVELVARCVELVARAELDASFTCRESVAPSTRAARDARDASSVCSADAQANAQAAALAQRADELQAEIASIGVALDVERDAAAAERKLDELWRRAASAEPYPRQLDVLLAVMEARAQLFQRSGDAAKLVRALEQLLPRDDSAADARGAAAASKAPKNAASAYPAALVALEAEALAGPRVAALRARFAPAQAETDGDQRLAAYVKERVDLSDLNSIKNLGVRALPALERIAREYGKGYVSRSLDPLLAIAMLSPARAAAFVESMGVAGGIEWTLRVRDAVRASALLVDDAAWTDDPSHEPRGSPLQSVWTRFLEQHARRPGFLIEALDIVLRFAQHDALTPALRDAIADVVRGDDQEHALRLLVELKSDTAAVGAIARAGLRSPHAKVRAMASRKLVGLHDVEGLLAAAADSHDEVRANVAKVCVAYAGANNVRVTPSVGARELDALRALASDSSETVRVAAAEVFAKNSNVFDELDVASTLMRDPSVKVRRTLLTRAARPSTFAPLLEIAASQPEPEIAQAVYELLRSAWSGLGDKVDAPVERAALRGALIAQLRNPVLKTLREWKNSGGMDDLLLDPAVAAVAIEVAPREPGECHAIVSGLAQVLDKNDWQRVLGAAELAALRRLVVTEFAAGASDTSVPRLAAFGGARVASALLPLCTDAAVPSALRLIAALAVARWLPDQSRDAVLACAADPIWSHTELDASTRAVVVNVMHRSNVELDELQLALLEAPSAQPTFVRAFLRATVPSNVVRADVARHLLLLPVGTDKDWRNVTRRAFAALQPPIDETLAQRLLSGDFGDANDVLAAMGRLRDPRFLPYLRQQLLDGDFSSSPTAAASVVAPIVNYMNDDAVAALLDAAAQNPNARPACLEGLETIRKLRDEKARWEGRSSTEAARTKALDELVVLLGSNDEHVRAGAATSIATLGGVEHSAKLVRLLQDAAPRVREAAQQAIARLAAVPAPTPAAATNDGAQK